MRVLIAVCLASACRFDFVQHGIAADDAGADAHGDAEGDGGSGSGSGSGCVSPGIGDAFDNAVPCLGWGTAVTTNATLTSGGGILNASVSSNGDGGCQRDNVALGVEGVFAEVVAIASAGSTSLTVNANGNFWQIASTNGAVLAFEQNGDASVPIATYDATTMRWWRIRQVPAGTSYETSADGIVWTVHRTSNEQVPATAQVTLHGTATSVATPSVSQFAGIDICP